jgi:hypothetical protein
MTIGAVSGDRVHSVSHCAGSRPADGNLRPGEQVGLDFPDAAQAPGPQGRERKPGDVHESRRHRAVNENAVRVGDGGEAGSAVHGGAEDVAEPRHDPSGGQSDAQVREHVVGGDGLDEVEAVAAAGPALWLE